MQIVHIYLGIDSMHPRKTEKTWAYVLECESRPGVIRNGFHVEECTYHEGILRSLIRAFERINQTCEVHIHTENQYVLNALMNYLDGWIGKDFRNKKGQQVSEEWAAVYPHKIKHLIVPEPGKHEYSEWLAWMAKRTKETVEDIELKGA